MRWTSIVLLTLLLGCGDRQPIAASSLPPAGPVVPSGPRMALSGTVFERISGRPIEGARVYVWPLKNPTGGLGAPDGFNSDASGRFRIPNLHADLGAVWVIAQLQGYRQQCVAMATLGPDDVTADVALVSRDNLAAANAQVPTIPGTRMISGVVYEVTESGRRPIEGAGVGWDASGLDSVVADTWSDAAGRYVLCGMPTRQIQGLFGTTGFGSVSYVSVDAGSDAVDDIEMRRR
jgi:hypothetical protein